VAASPDPSSNPPPSVGLRVARLALRLPAPLSRAVVLDFGSSVLICGGLTRSGATTGAILKLAIGTKGLVRSGTLAGPVHDAGGAVLDGVGYVFGGGRFGPGAVAQRVTAAGRATSLGRLPAIRADLAAVTVGKEIVIVGGGTPASPDRRVLATTDGRSYTTIATLLIGVRYPAVAVAGGLVYVIGGATPAGDESAIQVFDPTTGRVRILGHLARGLGHASAFVVGGKLLIAGGRTGGQAQDAILSLDPATGRTHQVGRLPYRVSDAGSVVIGGVAYLIGGEGSVALGSITSISVR
jgi:hypothetical protein